MHIVHSSTVAATQPDPGINSLLDTIDQAYLKHLVARIAVPRHRINDRSNNIEISNWIEQKFSAYGFNTIRQGKLENIIASNTPGSQSLPAGLPITVSDTGDFLAIVANRHSNIHIKSLLQTAANYTPQLDVKALKVFLGMEKLFPHLLRSDHSPFWKHNIPAFMWTDTSEFRNPHYHLPSDLPDTLNYEFLQRVTQLLAAHSLWFVDNKYLRGDKYYSKYLNCSLR